MPQPTHKVLVSPSPGTVIAPIHQYTDEQLAKIKALREYAETLLLPPTDPYYAWELRWINKPDTMTRYSRASKWNFADAQKRIKATIEWRREYQPDLIPPDEVRVESETGKIERAKDLMPPGQESLVIIVDYKSTTLRTNPSISVARKVLHILQQHYVETLGRALVVNLPMLLSFFYKGISPFLDPVTRDKASTLFSFR
ncbi:hypothetical protein C0995_006723 [Termitomyces sp. Mi166|nr:hypothetical protein C0995_006723 [Termitomyces sp. Mi166\